MDNSISLKKKFLPQKIVIVFVVYSLLLCPCNNTTVIFVGIGKKKKRKNVFLLFLIKTVCTFDINCCLEMFEENSLTRIV